MNVAALESSSTPTASCVESSAPPSDEPDLVARATRGCSLAFTELFNRHYAAIHAFAWRLTLCSAEAADIAQDTFIQAARSLPSFRQDSSFKNWLYAIAANKSRDCHRQRMRQARLSSELAAAALADGVASSAATARIAEKHSVIRGALAALSPDLRAAIALVYYENMNHAEAARVLDCAESTVSWRIFCAKRKLKKALRHERL